MKRGGSDFMKLYVNTDRFKREGIKLHQVVVAITTEPDWEMGRRLLLTDVEGLEYGEYLLLEGWHCSCYDFDETQWEGIVYTRDELRRLAESDYNKHDVFWEEVLKQMQ